MSIQFQERRIRIGKHICILTRKMQITIAVAALLSAYILGAAILDSSGKEKIRAISTPAASAQTPAAANTASKAPNAQETKIAVHIAGAVCQPGLIQLSAGARVADAIEAAGGLTASADVNALNLAEAIGDGMKIYVPAIGEIAPVLTGKTGAPSPASGKININTAGIEQLTQLDGIGEATAKKIIAYRESHGAFQQIGDIQHVSGIGAAKYAQIQEHICI